MTIEVMANATSDTKCWAQFSVLLTVVGATATLGQKLSHADANARLEAGGVYLWSSSVCTEPVSGCTSYEGINEATVNGALTLKASCGCDVIVTGGRSYNRPPRSVQDLC